ncbi:MAG: hybrid sensor histidine kinase/response regulator [Candidatus Omnitrophica bacterium]|nr:hybrid sensor histidine kinase/response regulator [Candidatus Omnitrophota bacterium]
MTVTAVDLGIRKKPEGEKILLIEDNPDHAYLVRKSISEALKSQVDMAGTGEEGIAKLKSGNYDLVISDFNLPGMDGMEILQMVKEFNIDVPFIMLTGQGDEKVAVSAMKLGAYNYVVKDDVCYTILPRVISETLTKYRADKEKERFEREIREKSEALEKANQELKKLDELKSEFISSVSHEFRNPLNSIRESVELVLDGVVNANEEKGRRILEIAKTSAERLTILVNDLLDFSKLEAGKMKMEKEPADIKRIVQDAVDSMRPLAEKKRLKLEIVPPTEKIVVFADPLRIIQVLTNLISNAIKFTPEDGRIDVIAEPFDDPKPPVQKVKVSVKDTGIGISLENLSRIFERFEQVKQPHRGKTPELQGTGLGLSICQEIVKLHQGNIWAESELGKGSTFIFTLPRYR